MALQKAVNADDIEANLSWNCCMIEHLFPTEKIDGNYPYSRYLEHIEAALKMQEKKPEPSGPRTVMTLRR
jgi:hypothetical protein